MPECFGLRIISAPPGCHIRCRSGVRVPVPTLGHSAICVAMQFDAVTVEIYFWKMSVITFSRTKVSVVNEIAAHSILFLLRGVV